VERQTERGVSGDHDQQQVHDVEGRDNPEQAKQWEREKVLEDRVVVKREIGRTAERKDFLCEQRQAFVQHLVAEHPLVPDVDTRIAADWSRQMRVEMKDQRPGEGHREQHVPDESTQTHPAWRGRDA